MVETQSAARTRNARLVEAIFAGSCVGAVKEGAPATAITEAGISRGRQVKAEERRLTRGPMCGWRGT